MNDVEKDIKKTEKILNKIDEENELDEYDRLNYDDASEEIDDNLDELDDIEAARKEFEYLQGEDALEGMDSVMDAESDAEDEDEITLAETAYANQILAQCEGMDDDNEAKAGIAINVFTQDVSRPNDDTVKTVAHSAFSAASLQFNRRNNFLEVVLNYQTPTENEMSVVYSYLETYGKMLNSLNDTSTVLPYFTMHVVPNGALGTAFVVFKDPTAWYLTSARPCEFPTQVRILFESNDKVDNVEFYENDEIDIESVDADAQRDLDAQAEAYAKAEEIEQEEKRKRDQISELMEGLRRGNKM